MDLVSTKCSILGPEAKENEIQNIWSSPEGGLERVGLQGWETRSWIVNSNFFPGVVYIIEIRITIPSCRLLLRLASPSPKSSFFPNEKLELQERRLRRRRPTTR